MRDCPFCLGAGLGCLVMASTLGLWLCLRFVLHVAVGGLTLGLLAFVLSLAALEGVRR